MEMEDGGWRERRRRGLHIGQPDAVGDALDDLLPDVLLQLLAGSDILLLLGLRLGAVRELAELWLFVGFLCFDTLFQNFARISP